MSSEFDSKQSPLIDKDYVSINNNRDIHCLDLSIVRTISCTRKLTSKEKELLTDFTIEEDEWRHRGELLAIAIKNEIKMDEARERTIQAAINIEERKVLDISRLSDDDLNYLERTLKHALVDPDTSGEDAKVPQIVHKGSMGNNRTQ